MPADVYSELDRHCRGFARIKLDDIEFDSGRELDEKSVKRLVTIFKLTGCNRENPANAISVIVEKDILANLHTENHYRLSGLHSLEPSQLPWLQSKTVCLHGKHRICAAREVLSFSGGWWTVKLFDTDLPLRAQDHIRFECSNSFEFSHGDIFRHHLDAESRGDQDSAKEWLSRIPKGRHSRIQQLKKNKDLLEAFLDLVPFTGLWNDNYLGSLEHELAMRCREEQCCYLRSIRRMWRYILEPDVKPRWLDAKTVKLFHVLMPANSSVDARTVRKQMASGEAFPGIQDERVRQNLEARLVRCDRILTFESFHKDMILLNAWFQSLRPMFPTFDTTLQAACQASFRHDPKYFWTNYIDVCLRVLCKHPYLSDEQNARVKKHRSKYQAITCVKDETEISKLVHFTASRGFWNHDIENLLSRHAAKPDPVGTRIPALSRDKGTLRHNYRCSRPRGSDFAREWRHISPRSIFQIQSGPCRKYPTAFAVVRDMARSFWGPVIPGWIDDPSRILQGHQLIEYASRTGNAEGHGVTEKDDVVEGWSNDLRNMPRSASSIYSPSRRSLSSDDGTSWSENEFIDWYDPPCDTCTKKKECLKKDDSLLTFGSEAPLLAQNVASSGRSVARRESQAQVSSSQAERSHKQHRRARLGIVDTSRRPRQQTGNSKKDFRITKSGHFNNNRMAKQRQETLKTAWQHHTETLSQPKLANAYTDLIPPFPMHDDSPVFGNVPPNREVPTTSPSLAQPQFERDRNIEHAQDLWEIATTEEEDYTSTGLQQKQPTLHQKKQTCHFVDNRTSQAKENTHGAAEVVDGLYNGDTDSSGEDEASAETDRNRNRNQDQALQDSDHEGNEAMIREGPQRAAAGDSCFRSHLEEVRKQQENNEGGKVSQISLKRDHNQARMERTDDVLHRIKIKTGNGSTKHRVEKCRRRIPKDKAKQHEAKTAKVLQKHAGVPQETASQADLTSLSGDGSPGVDDADINAMRQFLAGPPYGSEDCRNTSSTTEPVTSREQLSNKAILGNNGSRHVSNADDSSNDNNGHDETRSTQRQLENEETLETSAHENLHQSLRHVEQLSSDYHLASLDVHEKDTHADCDVDRSMRDVAEQIRSATDVVDEVYANSVFSDAQDEGVRNNDEITDSNQSTTSPPFPAVPTLSGSQRNENNNTPLGPSRIDSLNESQEEVEGMTTSKQHKRKAIRDAKEIGHESTSALSGSGTSHWLLDQCTTSDPLSSIGGRNDRPKSEFPGISMNPGGLKQVLGSPSKAEVARLQEDPNLHEKIDSTPLSTDRVLGKKRKWQDEAESTNVNIRSPKRGEPAQMFIWDSAEEMVASVERISDQLDLSLRIYVTSTVDIDILAPRRETVHKRLWSWSRTEKVQFHSQISRLLRGGYSLQLVTSNHPSTRREYIPVSHMDCWKTYFTDNSRYWLAILLPKPLEGLVGRKLRRTGDSSKF